MIVSKFIAYMYLYCVYRIKQVNIYKDKIKKIKSHRDAQNYLCYKFFASLEKGCFVLNDDYMLPHMLK